MEQTLAPRLLISLIDLTHMCLLHGSEICQHVVGSSTDSDSRDPFYSMKHHQQAVHIHRPQSLNSYTDIPVPHHKMASTHSAPKYATCKDRSKPTQRLPNKSWQLLAQSCCHHDSLTLIAMSR